MTYLYFYFYVSVTAYSIREENSLPEFNTFEETAFEFSWTRSPDSSFFFFI